MFESIRIFDFGTMIFQIIALAGICFFFYLLFLGVKALRKYLKN